MFQLRAKREDVFLLSVFETRQRRTVEESLRTQFFSEKKTLVG